MSRNGVDDYNVIAKICRDWWRELQSLNPAGKPIILKGGGEKAPDRAALAQLRRIGVIDLGGAPAVDVVGALDISAFRMLMARLQDERRVKRWIASKAREWEPFVIAAATLAHIRSDAGGHKRGATAKLLGEPRGEGNEAEDRLFAEARFKRLIRTRNDWPGLFAQARRIAAILEKEAPIGDLGASLILWNADPRTTRDWAFQYYQRAAAMPEAEPDAAPAII